MLVAKNGELINNETVEQYRNIPSTCGRLLHVKYFKYKYFKVGCCSPYNVRKCQAEGEKFTNLHVDSNFHFQGNVKVRLILTKCHTGFLIIHLRPPVDLPEVKGSHRKFRTVVASLIGREQPKPYLGPV